MFRRIDVVFGLLRLIPKAFVVLFALALLGATPEAFAQSSLYEAARAADEAGSVEEALRLYQVALEQDPSNRAAGRAIARVRALEPRVTDPGLAELESLLDAYPEAGSDRTVGAVESLLERDDIGDDTQLAARFWLANEHTLVRDDAAESVRYFLSVLELPSASDGQAETAIRLAVRALESRDDEERCRIALRELRRDRPHMESLGLDSVEDQLRDLAQRRIARPTAVATLLLFVGVWIRRRGWTRLRATRLGPGLLVIYAFGAGAWMGHEWEHGFVATFLAAGAACLGIYLFAGGLHLPAPSKRASLATASLTAAATISAVYLVTEALGTQAVLGL